MSDYYTKLIEKIEKQNTHSMKDRMEVQYQLRDISKKTQSMLADNGRYLKALIALQVAQIGSNHADTLAIFLKYLL